MIYIKSDKNLLSKIENLILDKRGFVTKIPKKAVFLWSGGFDSTICISYIIENWGTEVFPLFIRRGQRNLKYEERSLDYFNKLFIEKYPEKFHSVKKIQANIPAVEIKQSIPEDRIVKKGHPMRNPIMEMYGIQYAVTLGNDVKTVFIGATPSDVLPHSQLIALRSLMLSTCINMDEWDWQITTPLKDAYLGPILHKKDLYDWASNSKIPFNLTRSCIENQENPCGKCIGCLHRNEIKD